MHPSHKRDSALRRGLTTIDEVLNRGHPVQTVEIYCAALFLIVKDLTVTN